MAPYQYKWYYAIYSTQIRAICHFAIFVIRLNSFWHFIINCFLNTSCEYVKANIFNNSPVISPIKLLKFTLSLLYNVYIALAEMLYFCNIARAAILGPRTCLIKRPIILKTYIYSKWTYHDLLPREFEEKY